MVIAAGSVVSFDYVLHAPDGRVLDASEGKPLSYLHGAGHIVPGLERQLLGRQVGDALDVIVEAREAYGERTGQGFRVPRAELPAEMQPQVGMPLGARGPNGESMKLNVVGVDDDGISVTLDHPLSGLQLRFAVEIRAIRVATADELSHGHAHGHDGHDHSHGH